MQASNAPTKSAVPFAASGTKNTIPEASQIGVTPGAASFTDGFPPLTMTPLAAGGVPPYGADFNGILNFLSAAVRWGQTGAGYIYDAAFSTAIGGYPKGAMLKQAGALSGYWLNLVDNNTTNPDTGGANWVGLPAGIASTAQAQALTDDATALTPKKLADAFKGANQSLLSNGFQKLPGGLSLQWCTVSGSVGGTAVATFPFAFPNAALHAMPFYIAGSDPGTSASASVGGTLYAPLSTTAVNVRFAPGFSGCRIFAFGY